MITAAAKIFLEAGNSETSKIQHCQKLAGQIQLVRTFLDRIDVRHKLGPSKHLRPLGLDESFHSNSLKHLELVCYLDGHQHEAVGSPMQVNNHEATGAMTQV